MTKITWTAEKYQRLLAATIAAHPEIKINYNSVAAMFGEGATYDSIETRFRNVKKEAKKLQEEIANGFRPAVAPPTPRKRKRDAGICAPNTPRRIAKRTGQPVTPKKTPVKQEPSIDGEGEREVEVVDLEGVWAVSGDSDN